MQSILSSTQECQAYESCEVKLELRCVYFVLNIKKYCYYYYYYHFYYVEQIRFPKSYLQIL